MAYAASPIDLIPDSFLLSVTWMTLLSCLSAS
ncbi:MAG: DUF1232 domain-containing protein [Syntrophales bacterium]